MKKCILLLIILVALSACSKNEVLEPISNIDVIKYKSYTSQITKQSSEDSMEELKETGFVINASFTDNDKLYITNNLVTYDGAWNSVGSQKEWPMDSELSFLAIANNESISNLNISENPTFDYSISSDINSQKDLFIAYSKDVEKGNRGIANLKFKNALSKISVMVKADSNDPTLSLEITGIEILNVATEGTCEVSSTQGNSKAFNWTLNNQLSNVSLGLSAENAVIRGGSSTYSDVLSSNGHALVIPQSMTTISIKGVWRQNVDGASTIVEDFSSDESAKLIVLNENESNWSPDTNYIYNLDLIPNVISVNFDATIIGWEK